MSDTILIFTLLLQRMAHASLIKAIADQSILHSSLLCNIGIVTITISIAISHWHKTNLNKTTPSCHWIMSNDHLAKDTRQYENNQ